MIGATYSPERLRDPAPPVGRVDDERFPVRPTERPAPEPPAPRPTPKFHLSHTPALDGLRGIGVGVIVLFHGGVQFLGGAYLAMAMFFPLSGFLITTVLLEERITTGAIRLKVFWKRRARRLLPALIALLVAVGVYARFFADPIEAARLRGDSIATLFYGANWYSIVAKQDYWDLFRSPSLLQHTWSLAIEEQFYLVWPLILGGLLWWRRGSLHTFLAFCIALAVASAVWMAIVFDPNDISRAYLGTDTRVSGLLAGAALAAWLQIKGPTTSHSRRVALEALALAGGFVTLFFWMTLQYDQPIVYRGGMFFVSLLTVTVLASVSHPIKGPVASFLSWKPFCLLGLISYGLYLWHWPVIVILNQERLGLDGFALLVVQIAVSLVLAVLSYIYLEEPIRRHGFAAWRIRPLVPIAAVASIVAILALVAPREPATAEQKAAIEVQRNDADAVAQQANAPLAVKTDDPIAIAAPDLVKAGQPLPRPTNRWPREMFVGDSVALSLSMSMAQEPDRWKVEVANRSVVGCSLDDSSGTTRSAGGAVRKEDPACQSWPQRWERDLTQFRPDAVFVGFGGLQTDARQLDGGNWYRPCDASYQTWYRGQWDKALTLLASRGAIVFVAVPANLNLPTLYPDINEGFDCIRPTIRAAVAANPNARLINLDTWVCPTAATCRDEENGYKLRFDGAHYAGQGASVTNQWLQDQIFVPPS